MFGVDTVSLELASPHFYHLDTCLCVLSGGEILWYPPAFTPASRELLQALAADALIEVGDHDARHFGVNSVSIGRDLVMGHCSDELRESLQALGYRVTVVPLQPFWLSGGSAWCLTLRLDQASGLRETTGNEAGILARDDAGTCEVALVVADAWQGRGLGRLLMERLLQAARAAGIERAVVDVLCGNDAMLALARRYDFAAARSPYDSTMHRLELDLRGAALAAA